MEKSPSAASIGTTLMCIASCMLEVSYTCRCPTHMHRLSLCQAHTCCHNLVRFLIFHNQHVLALGGLNLHDQGLHTTACTPQGDLPHSMHPTGRSAPQHKPCSPCAVSPAAHPCDRPTLATGPPL